MTVITSWNLSLTADQVLRAIGSDPQVIRVRRPALLEAAEWAIKEGIPLLDPKVLYHQAAIKRFRHERLELDIPALSGGQAILKGHLIAQHLGPAEQVVILVCTIGAGLENIVTELMKTDPLLGWMLDGLGSAAVEALALEACNHFENQAVRNGKHTSLPLSPGMIGWPIEQGQPQIFTLVDGLEAGITLTSSGQMIPRKTLSMVLGVGENVGRSGRTCDFCSLNETCQYQNHYVPVQNQNNPTYPAARAAPQLGMDAMPVLPPGE
jgi:hypothetical protein